MSTQTIYLCTILAVFSNAWLEGREKAARGAAAMLLAVCCVIPLMTAGNWFAYALAIAAAIAVDLVLRWRIGRDDPGARIAYLAIVMPMAILITTIDGVDWGCSAFTQNILDALARIWRPLAGGFAEKDSRAALILALGAEISVYEANDFVRVVIPARITTDRLNMGKVIGYLERGLAYLLVVSDSIGLIGVIIAIKALARFKELEDKEFAEYFLVGTMSSLLAPIAIGIVVRRLMA
jgi:hypothetical protein